MRAARASFQKRLDSLGNTSVASDGQNRGRWEMKYTNATQRAPPTKNDESTADDERPTLKRREIYSN